MTRTRCVASLFVVLFLASRYAIAAPPQILRYQARLTDEAGIALSGIHELHFAIHDSATNGNELWSEIWSNFALTDGIVDIVLGTSPDPAPVPVPSSLFAGTDRWLEVTVDGTVLLPRQHLSSVPYAHAADRLGDKTLPEVLDRSAHTGIQPPSSVSPQGAGSGLDADRVDGLETGNAPGQLAVNNGTVNQDLNADLLDGMHASDIVAAVTGGVLVYSNKGIPPPINPVDSVAIPAGAFGPDDRLKVVALAADGATAGITVVTPLGSFTIVGCPGVLEAGAAAHPDPARWVAIHWARCVSGGQVQQTVLTDHDWLSAGFTVKLDANDASGGWSWWVYRIPR